MRKNSPTPEQTRFVKMESANLSVKEISKVLRIPESKIRYIQQKQGIKMRKIGNLSRGWTKKEHAILRDPNLTIYEKSKLIPHRTRQAIRIYATRHGYESKKIIFRRQFKSNGYVYLRQMGSYEKRARITASKKLGRLLTKDDIVHHINLVKDDDRPENLYVCSRHAHNRIHSSINKIIKKLLDDGIVRFTPERGYEIL